MLLNHEIDAASTDAPILLGYAKQYPTKLQVVGDTFSEERYGVGYPKGDTKFCQLITSAITESYKDGAWAKAFTTTLGPKVPQQPTADPCL
jgi:glutamate transport system substrate-binding protein